MRKCTLNVFMRENHGVRIILKWNFFYTSLKFNSAGRHEINYIEETPNYFNDLSSHKSDVLFCQYQSWSFNRWIIARADTGTHQSRWIEREVALLAHRVQHYETWNRNSARTTWVCTWCQRRNNLEVLARRGKLWLASMRLCRVSTQYAHAHYELIYEYVFARTSSLESRSYCTLSGGKCVRLTHITHPIHTRCPKRMIMHKSFFSLTKIWSKILSLYVEQ